MASPMAASSDSVSFSSGTCRVVGIVLPVIAGFDRLAVIHAAEFELVLAIALLITAKVIDWRKRWFPGWVDLSIEL
jgi:hypothetical protein